MIAKLVGAAATAVLVAVLAESCAQTSSPQPQASAGASGAAEMGRGRCEALRGPEREKCLADERKDPAPSAAQRSDDRK